MAWRELGSQQRGESTANGVIESFTIDQLDEQQQVAEATIVIFDMDDQRVGDCRVGFDRGVEVGGSEAHSPSVQGRIGTTADYARARVVDGYPVTVAPDTREGRVIGVVILRTIVTPKRDRHGRRGLGDNQLPFDVARRLTVSGERIDGPSELTTRYDPSDHRCDRRATKKRGAHVGAARDARQRHLRYLFVRPRKARRG